MEIIQDEWYSAIKDRRSRRTFQERKIKDNIFAKLTEEISQLNQSIKGARAVLIKKGCQDILTGVIGSYGIISGAEAYLAFIGDQADPHYQAKTGYLGQALILEATKQGLASCWVSGFFNPEKTAKNLDLADSEKVLAISPLGYARNKLTIKEKLIQKAVAGDNRKNINQICIDGFKSQWPNWIRMAIKTARLAPSAKNRQPWRFKVEDSVKVKIMLDKPEAEGKKILSSKRLDCGIAMLNFEVGALFAGAIGNWNYLSDQEVAEFTLDKIT